MKKIFFELLRKLRDKKQTLFCLFSNVIPTWDFGIATFSNTIKFPLI